jgi:hypothetical protein
MCHVKGFECDTCKTWIVRDSDAHDTSIVKHDDTNPLVDKIFCKNCEPKCESDSESKSDDGEVKEYRITDVEFDIEDVSEETLLEDFGIHDVEDRDAFLKEMIEETCSKTWFACDEEQLCNKISDENGWCISSFACELVCEGDIKVVEEKEKKYQVRVMQPTRVWNKHTMRLRPSNREITGYEMTSQRTFTDIEEARLCFTENVRIQKEVVIFLGDDNSINIEFDDITDECDPEMIETWCMKDETTDDECPFCKGEKCNLSHPPYFCDNGCGKIVGCGVDDECVRTCSCDSCK